MKTETNQAVHHIYQLLQIIDDVILYRRDKQTLDEQELATVRNAQRFIEEYALTLERPIPMSATDLGATFGQELEPIFNVGDKVRVIAGSHKGKEGEIHSIIGMGIAVNLLDVSHNPVLIIVDRIEHITE